MSERFIVDDAGTLIDMTNRDTYDYVSDVCELLNELHEENEQLKENIADWETSFDLLKHKNEQLKQQLKDCEKFRYNVFKRMDEVKMNDL